MSHWDARQLVFVDESGTHVALAPLYAWAPKGQRARGQVPRNRGRTTTLLAALSPEGILAPWTLEGGVDALAFETYVREVLAPTLKPGQIVILENLAAHQGDVIRQVVEAQGCRLLFLPSYSPDLARTLGGVLQDQNPLAPGSSPWARGSGGGDWTGGNSRDQCGCSWLVPACRISPASSSFMRSLMIPLAADATNGCLMRRDGEDCEAKGSLGPHAASGKLAYCLPGKEEETGWVICWENCWERS